MGAGLLPSTQGESDHSRAAQERMSRDNLDHVVSDNQRYS